MKIKPEIVIFHLSNEKDGMPIYVGNPDDPEFITSTDPPWNDLFDYKIETLLASLDKTPSTSYYTVRIRQACVLT